MNEKLSAKLKTLPARPGVYFHKSKSGEIIYVGKAAVLKNRVRSYFRGAHDTKTEALIREIADTDWIETDSEIDALFLESEMVKRYMPRYNILLRDDKNVSYVRIPFREKIPVVSVSRNPADDGAEYLGPFYSAAPLKISLRYLRKIFPFFAKAQDNYSKLPTQLGLVPEIYVDGKLDDEKLRDYKKNLRNLARYLSGEKVKIQRELEKEMKDFAKNQEFEKAAKIRNQLRNLNELRRQIIFSREEFMDVSKDAALADLQKILNLREIPRRIEAYDISHISGKNVVASMVVATNGVADRREYRKFKLSREINDDTANLREVLTRRFSTRNANWAKPNLIILDGGKPQISSVSEILIREKIAFFGRDKSGDHSRNSDVKIVILKDEKFVEIPLAKNSHVAKLIARLDDEAHRFAITYHQNLRAKNQTKNQLEEIAGIGKITRQKLMKKFGSVAKIRESSESEIAKIVGEKLAKIIKQDL